MEKLEKNLFRRAVAVTLKKGTGEEITGRGYVVKLKESAGVGYQGEYHQIGRLTKPLYVFTGDLPWADKGDVLKAGVKSYTVLCASQLSAAGKNVGLRAVLEEGDEIDDSQ